jgi:hypothetical protein
MSHNQDAAVDFADTILQHFPPYRWEDHQEKAWAERLVKELSGFSADVVKRAAGEIVRTRKKPQTPLVSECIEACGSAKRWTDANKNKGRLPIDGGSDPLGREDLDWTGERLKLANDLMDTPIGKTAAKENWIGALWSFAKKNQRLPQPAEISAVKTTSEDTDRLFKKCVTGDGWPKADAKKYPWLNQAAIDEHRKRCIAFGEAVMKRRQDLVDRVLHGVVK